MIKEEAAEEANRAALLARRMAIVLADLIEEHKDNAALIAKAHLVLAHAVLRNSVCCLPQLGAAIAGFYAILEPVIQAHHYGTPDGEHSH